jgi:hypothetical protein
MSEFKIQKDCPIIKNTTKSNKTFDFISCDSQESYLKNREDLGPEWYYYDKEIKYKYNSWGYRTKEFDDLKNEYFVSFGCSFTEGVGLAEEDTWVNKLSKELDVDSFNLSQGGTGVDFSTTNTVLLIDYLRNKNKKLPKFVVYQLSFNHRTFYSFKDVEYGEPTLSLELFSATYPVEVYPKSCEYFGSWYFHGFIENEGEMIKQSNLSLIICKNMWEMLGVPVHFWTYGDDFQNNHKDIFTHNIDFKIIHEMTEVKARDCAHNGHLAQDIIVNELKNDILFRR